MKKLQFTLAATLAACSVAFANATVQTFEDETAGKWTATEGWTVDPAVAESTDDSDYPAIVTDEQPLQPANGYGVVDAGHTKALNINGGKATLTFTGASTVTSDILVKVVRNGDDTLSTDGLSGAKIAIAVDSSGRFNACTNGTSFFTLSDQIYNEDTWVRVTTLIDTANSRCRVALDGQLACNGAWLSLPTSENAPSMLSVQSTSCIDDVVVKTETSNVYDKYAAVTTAGADATTTTGTATVPTNYLTLNNVAVDDLNPTVEEHYKQGVSPTANFAIASGSFDGSNVTLTFPGDWPADAYVVKYGSNPSLLSETADMTSNTKEGANNTVVVAGMTTGTVLYYKVARKDS